MTRADTLANAVGRVVSRMMAGGVTGEQAWRDEMARATNDTLMSWALDPLWKEPGCEYIGEHIANEMERRIAAAGPVKGPPAIDLGTRDR